MKDLANRRDQFAGAVFFDDERVVLEADAGLVGKSAHEEDLAGVLADVDEATGSGYAFAEARNVDVASRVHFGHAQKRLIETSSVVEVELGRLMDDGFGVAHGPEAETSHRDPADTAGLHRQGDLVEHSLFEGHRGHALGHTDAQVDDRARHQFLSGAARDHFAFVQFQRLEGGWRGHHFARVSRIVMLGESLRMILSRRQHHGVHQDPRQGDQLGMKLVTLGQALDLHDDQASAVVNGLSDGQSFQAQRFPFHGDIASTVGCGAAQQRDLNGESLVKEPFFAPELHHLDQVLGRFLIEPVAFLAWVHEGMQAYVSDDSRLASGDIAIEM